MAAFNLNAFDRDRVEAREVEALENRNCRRREENREAVNAQVRNRDCEDENVLAANRNQATLRRLREECIIAFKVYDSCRQQDCLGPEELGPARAAEDICVDGETICEGQVINPPNDAAAVTIDRLRVKKIIIVYKRPNELRRGYWDIDLKYVFAYRLTFRNARGEIILVARADSIFNKKVTLFGSVGANLAIGTDLLQASDGNVTLDAEPFVLVEAKAIALDAQLVYQRRRNDGVEDFSPVPVAVHVTIGLFTIIKLFRIVNLSVESRGFCVPQECEEISPLNPCEFFDNQNFPLDAFAPPQLPEFRAGISNDIPRGNVRGVRDCGR